MKITCFFLFFWGAHLLRGRNSKASGNGVPPVSGAKLEEKCKNCWVAHPELADADELGLIGFNISQVVTH